MHVDISFVSFFSMHAIRNCESTPCLSELTEDDDSGSEFGGRQSSGSRGTPSGQQWQPAAARYGGSSIATSLHTMLIIL